VFPDLYCGLEDTFDCTAVRPILNTRLNGTEGCYQVPAKGIEHGTELKYLVRARGQPIACFCWSSAPRHLGPRDRHIGWAPAVRKANIRFVAYQSRFLILPWVHVPHLASHLLGAISRRLSADWQSVYAHPIYFTETFIDPDRFRGTCYRAANWTFLGMTAGRGKDAPTKQPNRSLKQLLGYPLVKDFQKRLCADL